MAIYALYGAIYHQQLSHFVFFLAPSCDLMQGQQKELCAVSVLCVCVYTMCICVCALGRKLQLSCNRKAAAAATTTMTSFSL